MRRESRGTSSRGAPSTNALHGHFLRRLTVLLLLVDYAHALESTWSLAKKRREMSNRAATTPAVSTLKSTTANSLSRTNHAANLREHGFTIVHQPVAYAALITSAAAEIEAIMVRTHAELRAAGCDPTEQSYEFNEICHRSEKRWMLQLSSLGTPACSTLLDQAARAAAPILAEALPTGTRLETMAHHDAIVTRCGAKTQPWHMDATREHCAAAQRDPAHRLFNLFVPLIDIAEGGLGTQFRLGSHLLDHAAHGQEASGSMLDGAEAAQIAAPACEAGGIIIFDHRLILRGVANGERERAIVHGVVSAGGAVFGPSEFPSERIRDASKEEMHRLPYW